MKKFISAFLALLICVGSTVSAFAVSEGDVVIDRDGVKATVQQFEDKLVVKVEYEDRYEITTCEEGADTMTTKVFNYDGELIDMYMNDVPDPNAPTTYDFYQHIFSNYEYDVDTSQRHQIWTCRRDNDYKTKKRLPGSITEERLLHWKEEVDDINSAELALLSGAGSTVLSAVVGALKGGQLGAAIAMVKGSAQLVKNVDTMYAAMGRADAVFAKL